MTGSKNRASSEPGFEARDNGGEVPGKCRGGFAQRYAAQSKIAAATTTAAITTAKLLQRFTPNPPAPEVLVEEAETAEVAPEDQAYPLWVSLVAMGVVVALCPRKSPLLGLVSATIPLLVPGNTCVAVVEQAPTVGVDFAEVIAASTSSGIKSSAWPGLAITISAQTRIASCLMR